ncbi:MAG: alpha/beta hydrolase [Pseudonocardiales bacterium]|nr:alpha/beta hydrolase [Pseudonocardiales bacterium]
MTVVFVHGVPETDAVWRPLLGALGRDDVVCLSPPGFGAPVPPGFGATYAEYRGWLINELQRLEGPVDLVGHDWGGAHVIHVAMSRPDLLRSWVTDVIGVYDPDYVWHDLAQTWQQPGAGEERVDAMMNAPLEQRAERLVRQGVTPEVARDISAGQDEVMGRCILALYRSAAQPVLRQLGDDLPTAAQRPGLAVLATEDHYVGTVEMRRRAAARAGAQLAGLEGLGHWWMVQDPPTAAKHLTDFWATLT